MQLSSFNQTSAGIRNSVELNSFNNSPRELNDDESMDEADEFMQLGSSSSIRLFNDPSTSNAHQNLNNHDDLEYRQKNIKY
jgi:hypothetical protein